MNQTEISQAEMRAQTWVSHYGKDGALNKVRNVLDNLNLCLNITSGEVFKNIEADVKYNESVRAEIEKL